MLTSSDGNGARDKEGDGDGDGDGDSDGNAAVQVMAMQQRQRGQGDRGTGGPEGQLREISLSGDITLVVWSVCAHCGRRLEWMYSVAVISTWYRILNLIN